MKKLDLGCGKDKEENAIGLDHVDYQGVDVVFDLEKTKDEELQFEDNSFDEVYAYDVLEHIEHLVPLVKEIHRILKKGGKLFAISPYYTCRTAYTDPTHVRYFTENTMKFFDSTSKFYSTAGAFGDLDFDVTVKKIRGFQHRGGGRYLKNKWLRRLAYIVIHPLSFWKTIELEMILEKR